MKNPVCVFTEICPNYGACFPGGGISGRFYFVFDTSTMYNLPTRYMFYIWSYKKENSNVKNKHLTKLLA